MPEVVFILKADTKPGEAHVRQFANRAEDALRKAFSIEPGNIDLAKALGLNQAVNELSTLQKQLQSVQKSLSSLNSLQLKQFRRATIQTIAGVEFDPNITTGRRTEFEPNAGSKGGFRDVRTGRFTKHSEFSAGAFIDTKHGGGVLGRPEAINRLQQAGSSLEVSEINKAISGSLVKEIVEKERLLNDILGRRVKIETERVAKETQLLRQQFAFGMTGNRGKGGFFAEQFDVMRNKQTQEGIVSSGDFLADTQKKLAETLQLRLRKEAELLRQQFAFGMTGNRGKGGFFAEQFDVMRNKQVKGSVQSSGDFIRETQAQQARQAREADLTRRRGGRTFTNADIIGSEQAYRSLYLHEMAQKFSATGRGQPSSIAKLFGAREQSFQEFTRHERTKGKRIGPEQALGISPTATRLLALSSVLAPLNSQLGAVAMQAGFAAFSLGAPVAALSLLASAVAGFTAVLKKGVATAKEAGLETVKYSKATIGLAAEMRAFFNVIGVKTQVAFAPVVDEITELFKEIEKLPWDDIISGAGEAAKALAEMAKFIAQVSNATGIPSILENFSNLQEMAGLQGKQKVDIGKIVGGAAIGPSFGSQSLFKELREMFGPPGDREEFVKEPRFDFAEIESVGRNMQKAILASESQDPQTRALQAIDRTSREQLSELRKLNNPTREVTKGVVEGVLGF